MGTQSTATDFGNAVLDQAHRWTMGLRGLIEAQSKDARGAILKYQEANAKSMTNSMNTKWWEDGVIKDSKSSVLGPLIEWLMCYGPVLSGIFTQSTGEFVCQAKDFMSEVFGEIDAIENKLLDAISFNGKSLLDIKEWIVEQGPFLVMEELAGILDRISKELGVKEGFPVDASRLHVALSFNGKDKLVDDQFETVKGDQDLVEFKGSGKVTTRIKADMRLRSDKFRANDFVIIANSVQLAKLSLLNATGLNRLAEKLGYDGSEVLYTGDTENVLTDWLRSIDGHHQWLVLAPPSLRGSGANDSLWVKSFDSLADPNATTIELDRIYGFFPRIRKNGGMRYYLQKDARRKVFLKLFKGPLSPSLFNLGGNFPAVVPDDYIYKPSKRSPFPEVEVHKKLYWTET